MKSVRQISMSLMIAFLAMAAMAGCGKSDKSADVIKPINLNQCGGKACL